MSYNFHRVVKDYGPAFANADDHMPFTAFVEEISSGTADGTFVITRADMEAAYDDILSTGYPEEERDFDLVKAYRNYREGEENEGRHNTTGIECLYEFADACIELNKMSLGLWDENDLLELEAY
jgi:hypothetical protein